MVQPRSHGLIQNPLQLAKASPENQNLIYTVNDSLWNGIWGLQCQHANLYPEPRPWVNGDEIGRAEVKDLQTHPALSSYTHCTRKAIPLWPNICKLLQGCNATFNPSNQERWKNHLWIKHTVQSNDLRLQKRWEIGRSRRTQQKCQ